MSRVLAPLGQVRPGPQSAVAGLELDAARHHFRFDVRWAGEGFPEDVRRVLADLSKPVDRADGGVVTVVAARCLSPGARRLLRERRLSWADESGAALIVAAPGLLVDRTGEPARAAMPGARWAWSAGSAAVAETVLADAMRAPGAVQHRLPGAAQLAVRAGVSVSMVNTTLRGWQAEGWIEKRGGQRGPTSTRLLVGAGELLSSWAAWVAAQPVHELPVAATFSDAVAWTQTQLRSVMPHGQSWCLGGVVASELQAPYGTQVSRVLCHVTDSVFDMIGDSLGRRGPAPAPDDRGGLVLRAARPSTIALVGRGPVPIASTPRVYADLVAELGPSHEAVAHFRNVACGC